MRTLWRIIAGFFKWTWRLLNIIRELVMNLLFLLLVLVCVGVWMQFNSGPSEPGRGALLLNI
ncbi:hypothetical protein QLZ15_21400, partial [Cronobacter sakazakii]|nr:hypothetical protein [Cronobacter sakazakii]